MFLKQVFQATLFTGLVITLLTNVGLASLLTDISSRSQNTENYRFNHSDYVTSSVFRCDSNCGTSSKPSPTSPIPPDESNPKNSNHKFSPCTTSSSLGSTGINLSGSAGPPISLDLFNWAISRDDHCLGSVMDGYRRSWPSPPLLELLKIPIALEFSVAV